MNNKRDLSLRKYACADSKKAFLNNIKVVFSPKNWVIPRKSYTFATLEPAKPLNDAQMCGSFYFYTMSNRISFQKICICATQKQLVNKFPCKSVASP